MGTVLTWFDVQMYHARVVDVLQPKGDLQKDVLEFRLLKMIACLCVFNYSSLQTPTYGRTENGPSV